jgi:hypothetical protein
MRKQWGTPLIKLEFRQPLKLLERRKISNNLVEKLVIRSNRLLGIDITIHKTKNDHLRDSGTKFQHLMAGSAHHDININHKLVNMNRVVSRKTIKI